MRTVLVARFIFFSVAAAALTAADTSADASPGLKQRTVQVNGTGTDLSNGAIVHSKHNTSAGMIQQSTETVELAGDLQGRVLYQVTSVFDFNAHTLVNTGNQVYSGTIAGSAPVMLHDSRFRFDVNLTTGEDSGAVYLSDHIAGPAVRCTLKVHGTGKDSAGNPTFRYGGQCVFAGAP